MRHSLILTVAAAVVVLTAAGAAAQTNTGKGSFEVTGMGGAGGMYTPTISPYDNQLMFMSCDMSGSYRSTDGGKSWRLIHYKQIHSSLRARPAFTKDAVYWDDSGSILKVSRDKGETWQEVVKGDGPWKAGITHIAAGQSVLCVGGAEGVWISSDAGRTWTKAAEGKCAGLIALGKGVYYVAKDKVAVTTDGGKSSKDVSPAEAKGAILMLTGAAAGQNAEPCLYIIVDKAGILKSADGGAKWEEVMKPQGQNDILMPANQDKVCYASSRKDVWRTDDGGKTWKSIFDMAKNVERSWVQTQLSWGYSISPWGLGIDFANPESAMVTTQGDFYRTKDGGKSWYQAMNQPVGVQPGDPGFRYKSIGLEVTSVWDCQFDPNDPNRYYICYTDIGFARSVDKGQTWISSVKGCPWSNTFYQIAFDPFVKGRIYAANSNRHDIPHWTHVDANKPNHAGGVCVSDDYGASWKVLNDKLPKLPCTGIVIDPKSEKDKLTMYATFYEGGVYKTTDGGKTWTKKADGLGNPGNLHCYKVKIHPKSGNLYCVVVAMRVGANTFPVPGGLWKSIDGGDSWQDITAGLKLHWPTDFALHPTDENTVYLTAATIPGGPEGGGYKTTDGGKTWAHIMTDAMQAKWSPPSYCHAMMVKLHPDDPNTVYLAAHGLWVSKDAGKTWEVFEKFPFSGVQNIQFDPADHKNLFITTFGGGLWKGGATPINN
ncbi:MAG: WD40/YVTN/BNR-like repeat-containing protein [Phycisphaerae bacterium]